MDTPLPHVNMASEPPASELLTGRTSFANIATVQTGPVMYSLIGSDNKEYGPVTTEKLQQWISEGRANAETRVRREGATDWQPLSAIPELAPFLPIATVQTDPVMYSLIGADNREYCLVTKRTALTAMLTLEAE
jgi:hypothetical protein